MADRAPDEHLDIWRECLTRADAVTDPFERLGAWRDIRVAFPAVLDELVAERARAEAAEAELAELKTVRHGDPHMFGAVLGYELGEEESDRERQRLRHLVDVLRRSRQLWRDRFEASSERPRIQLSRTDTASVHAEAADGKWATAEDEADRWGMRAARAEAKLSAVRELVDSEDQSRDIVDQIRVLLDGQENPTDV